MSVSSTEDFCNYYNGLLKNPNSTTSEQLPNEIYNTIQAFGEWKKNSVNNDVSFGNRTIKVSELKSPAIEIFAKFAEQYVHTHPFKEENAIQLIDHLNAYSEFQNVKRQLLIYEQIAEPEVSDHPIVGIRNRLSQILQVEQKKAQEDVKARESKDKWIRGWGVALTAVGLGVLGGTIGAAVALSATTLGLAGGIVLVFVTGFLIYGPAIGFGVSMMASPSDFFPGEETASRLERIEKYKKLTEDENFPIFASQHALQEIKDEYGLLRFFELYEKHQKRIEKEKKRADRIKGR